MSFKPTMLLAFLALLGCQHQALPAASAKTTPAAAPAHAAAEPAPGAAATLNDANRACAAQLSVPRGEQLETFRQITELEHARRLYQEFLERAEGRPELEPAVRRARERIADLTDTLIFLGPDRVPAR